MKWTLPFFLLFIISLSPLYAETANPTGWSNIEHVVIIMFENASAKEARQQPYFGSLATQWGYLSNYHAVTHPSQPNYIALTAGNTYGVTSDQNANLNVRHIGNLLEAKNKTWKAYAENYPGNCFTGTKSNGLYYRKHVPFISFENVTGNLGECQKVVAGSQLFTDLANNNLPTYSFYVPNIDNDGHDTGAAYADQWLSKTFGSILQNSNVLKNTLFILTFDEDDYSASNNVYAVFVGAGVKPKTTSSANYNHYSLLKTIESIFGLDTLGEKDLTATTISGIWQNTVG